jgi:hypothetical protein
MFPASAPMRRRARAYAAIDVIDRQGGFRLRDTGWRAFA